MLRWDIPITSRSSQLRDSGVSGARARTNHLQFRVDRLAQLVLATVLCSTLGCTTSPPAPEMPQAVASLARQYDGANAKLDADSARAVLERTIPLQAVLGAFSGLEFLRDIVEDATSVEFDESELAIDVQGSIDAHTPCPGWEPNAPEDDAIQGFIDVTIGVENSRVQRAFSGHTTNCRFLAGRAGTPSNVSATMNIQVDLGRSLGFGDPTPSILVRGSDVDGSVNGVAIDLASQVVSFRLGTDDSVETFVDLKTLGLDLTGSVLLTSHEDGSWALRVRDGEWSCAAEGSTPCVFDGV